ncbi:hypothetical protein PHLCEN_2v1848 [Hermanssonia centrifuga]|uniref:Uncharacterized protein n=1 Tax=Hermanssonia centrifuga TaxID=98765 RepID=A0A2R6RVR1_9APHY|nr:hypothetical protein PHLCEN_2v1848 [Hermanssonia centrifuga]
MAESGARPQQITAKLADPANTAQPAVFHQKAIAEHNQQQLDAQLNVSQQRLPSTPQVSVECIPKIHQGTSLPLVDPPSFNSAAGSEEQLDEDVTVRDRGKKRPLVVESSESDSEAKSAREKSLREGNRKRKRKSKGQKTLRVQPEPDAVDADDFLADIDVPAVKPATSPAEDRSRNVNNFFGQNFDSIGVNGITKKYRNCMVCM